MTVVAEGLTAIEMNHWRTFSGRFSREHDGWSASLQLRRPDGEVETAIDDRPFRGVTFEQRDGHEALILTFGDDAEEHLAHIIERPRDLAVLGDEGRSSLIIGLADGSGCVLELESPFYFVG